MNAGPSAAAIAIRGISFEDIEKSFDPAVGVLIDGVYLGTNTGQLTDAFDVQSIEVLRGPQGTLFGRNTTGGVISLRRTRRPASGASTSTPSRATTAAWTTTLVVNLPEIANVSTKLFYSRRISDGYVDNVTLNRDDTNRSDVQRYGVSFLWKPIAGFDDLLTIEREKENSRPDQGSLSTSGDIVCGGIPVPWPRSGARSCFPATRRPSPRPANECNRNTSGDLYTTFTNILQRAVNDEIDVTNEANYHIGNITLTSVTGYRTSHEDTVQDFDATSVRFYETDRPERYHQVSQELRAAGQHHAHARLRRRRLLLRQRVQELADHEPGPGVHLDRRRAAGVRHPRRAAGRNPDPPDRHPQLDVLRHLRRPELAVPAQVADHGRRPPDLGRQERRQRVGRRLPRPRQGTPGTSSPPRPRSTTSRPPTSWPTSAIPKATAPAASTVAARPRCRPARPTTPRP